MLWLVPGLAFTKYRCEFGTLFCIYAAKVPGSELARVLLADSLQGANWPGSEKAVNRVGLGLDKISSSYIMHNVSGIAFNTLLVG